MFRTPRRMFAARSVLALLSVVVLMVAVPVEVVAQECGGDAAQGCAKAESQGRGCGGCQGGCGQGMGQQRGGCGKGQGEGAGAMRHGDSGRGMHRGQGSGRGMGQGKGCMVDGNCAMRTAMSLVHARAGIERTVEEVEGGVRTITTAESAELAETIERHVREAQQLLERGGALRMWDPLFAAIFEHHDQISLEYERIENGVVVTETSEDPWVTELIRAHAQKVNDFLARGPAAVHEATEVPPKDPLSGNEVGSTEGGR